MIQDKKAQVIMLPTDNISKLRTYCDKQLHISNSIRKEPYYQDLELHIISDDEIKEGDWCINQGDYDKDIVFKADELFFDIGLEAKKIIATTDKSLFILKDCPVRGSDSNVKYILPQPSQQFIEEFIESYNKGEIITDVLIEYDLPIFKQPFNSEIKAGYQPKVNPDNTITIKKVKPSLKDIMKDNPSIREEIIDILHKYGLNLIEQIETKTLEEQVDINQWIEENL